MTMSFLKMVMKSRKRSTQCLQTNHMTFVSQFRLIKPFKQTVPEIKLELCALWTEAATSFSPNVVFVSVLGFLNDELSVEQDEAAHEQQPQVHVSLSGERTIRTEEEE